MSKVIIATAKQNNDWYNVTDNTGREISVSLKSKEGKLQNQKLKAVLDTVKPGEEVEMEVKDWKGKWFGNEPKSFNGAGKKFAPADRSFDAAKTAALAVATLYANKTDVSGLPATFETIHKLIMAKVTKATEEAQS